MATLDVIVNRHAVNAYLTEHGLEHGNAPIVALLMQHHEDTPTKQPQVMVIIEVDGKPMVAKTTLRLLEVACRAMRAASGIDSDGNPQPPAQQGS